MPHRCLQLYHLTGYVGHSSQMADVFAFVADQGFNAVRILLNHRSVLDNAPLDTKRLSLTNPKMEQLRYLEALKLVISTLTQPACIRSSSPAQYSED